jgi:glycine dehydrogenase subunit 1
MRYSGSTKQSRADMLAAIGKGSVEDLLESIPAEARMKRPLDVEGPLAESDLLGRLDAMKSGRPRVALVGAGLYQHYVPAPVDALCGRSEWVTSYTPYQPELAQGTLVMYWEFQTYVAQLTGQEIANGGMYDGSTALAEAVLMAMRLRPDKKNVYVSEGVHPEYRAVLATYLRYHDVHLETLPIDRATGRTRLDLPPQAQKDAVALVLQSPNFFGIVEKPGTLDPDAFLIGVCTEALSLALLTPLPARIAVGECQSFGIPMQLGGPTAGFFATRKEYVRQMPGRLVGRSVDADGREAFCITLATREQFIRREKATSNICTSSGLMCLRATTYLSLLGRKGLVDLAEKNARAARFFAAGLESLGLRLEHKGPYFNEFVVDASSRPGLYERLLEKDVVFGVPLARWFPELRNRYLINVTEVHYAGLRGVLEEVKSAVHGS